MPEQPRNRPTLGTRSRLDGYRFFTGPKPRIIGHRGAMGVAPENTLVSFSRAFAQGATLVEFDLRQTQDGEVVILHDATLERTTDGAGPVGAHSLRELKLLDAGFRFTPDGGTTFPFRGENLEIPTLADFLSSFPQARAIVEIKHLSPTIIVQTFQTIDRFHAADRVLLATEEDIVMAAIRAECERRGLAIATGFSYSEVARFVRWVEGGAADAYEPPGQAFQIPPAYDTVTLVSAATVQAAHRLEVEMFVWTINEAAEMKALLNLGVDGIITDYPGRLIDALAQQAPPGP